MNNKISTETQFKVGDIVEYCSDKDQKIRSKIIGICFNEYTIEAPIMGSIVTFKASANKLKKIDVIDSSKCANKVEGLKQASDNLETVSNRGLKRREEISHADINKIKFAKCKTEQSSNDVKVVMMPIVMNTIKCKHCGESPF